MSRAELLTSQHLQLRLSDLLEATWLVKPGLAATSAILSRNMPKYPNIFEWVAGRQSMLHASTTPSFIWMYFCFIINSIISTSPARRISGSCRSGPAPCSYPDGRRAARPLGQRSLRKPFDSSWGVIRNINNCEFDRSLSFSLGTALQLLATKLHRNNPSRTKSSQPRRSECEDPPDAKLGEAAEARPLF